MTNIKVSVFVLCYNQVKFIRKCLDSIVNQKTNFDFEVVVHDDCSDDGTKEVIEEYASKYSFIKPIYESENQYILKNIYGVLKKSYLKCNGDYIAYLEGDDYWTDEDKLQTQVDFLDNNPDFSGCFHKSLRKNIVTGEDVCFKPSIEELKGKDVFAIDDTINGYFIETCSVMYRWNEYKKEFLDILPPEILNTDTYCIYYHSFKGKIKYIDKLMSVKTINESGVWNSVKQTIDERNVRFWLEIINFPIEVRKLFDKFDFKTPYYDTPESAMRRVLASAINIKRFDVIEKASERFPEVFSDLIKQPNDKSGEINYLKRKIKKYKKATFIFLSLAIIFMLIIFALSVCLFNLINDYKESRTAIFGKLKNAKIVIKADDLIKYDRNVKRFNNIIKKENIKANWGIVANSLENADEDYINFIKNSDKDRFGFFNHGYTHSIKVTPQDKIVCEFGGKTMQEQLRYLKDAQKLVKDKTGLALNAFGAPCNQINLETKKALEQIDDIKIWYFGLDAKDKIILKRYSEIEISVGKPSYQYFIKKTAKYLLDENSNKALVITYQIHPNSWNTKDRREFRKIVKFLKNSGASFILQDDMLK